MTPGLIRVMILLLPLLSRLIISRSRKVQRKPLWLSKAHDFGRSLPFYQASATWIASDAIHVPCLKPPSGLFPINLYHQ